MTKLNLGTIGTSGITELFIEAALQTNQYRLKAVYSRSKERAEEFNKPYQAENVYDGLDELLYNKELDVVYIASPNSLHYEQTLQALQAGKHVLVEKPAFTNPKQWEHVEKVAREKDRVVIEAVRHIQEPNYQIVKNEIEKLKEIQGATLSYMSYSSRFDQVRAGSEPNIFSPKFAGGSLMDLGVYPLYTAIEWFGEPETVHCFVNKIETGVDGKGTAILRYPNFDVTILFGKTATTTFPSEVYGLEQTVRINHVALIETIEKIDVRTKEVAEVESNPVASNMLVDEARVFADILLNLQNPDMISYVNELTELAKKVSRTLYRLRKDADILFDSKE